MELLLIIMLFITMIMGTYISMFNLEIYVQWEIFSMNSMSMSWIMLFDCYSILFMMTVLFISIMVMFYSNEYMSEDIFIYRFKLLVLWFVMSMLLLVLSPNLVSMILGWDGLGLSSYCLVIYYNNYKSNAAGMITVLTNRIGDVILLFSISIMSVYGQFDYLLTDSKKFLGLLAILIAMTKSAQIPFSAWLPAAMAAPTPVSSLVHSSTLVTAGVYFLFRFAEKTAAYSESLLFMGALTMLISGLSGCYELDFKKVIALSTLSQLGMMFFGLGLMAYNWVFFHLLIHALFKSLMFMCAGVIIHSMKSSQDFRIMGGMLMTFPFIKSLLLFSVLSLCGIPYLGGFYSKDLLVEMFFMFNMNSVSIMMFIFSLFFTLLYSMRFCMKLMMGSFNGFTIMNYNYTNNFFYSLFLLYFMGLFSGYTILQMINKLTLLSFPSFEEKFLAFCLFLMIFFISLSGSTLKMNKLLEIFFSDMFGMSKLSSWVSITSLKLSNHYLMFLEMGWLEKLGPQGLSLSVNWMSMKISGLSFDYMNSYFMLYYFWFFILMMIL
uniref:NADH-ubiquinone oxidoreductase chain 5 n=1 Tax=Argulus americanus TaxID=260819 RepID=Q6SL27_9CRUS|nr:NADH dehydrogenase subunit 5 [Argulus americanus]AAS00846.1 NADH dehydrogenase subunit 5 [Argulus americanus]